MIKRLLKKYHYPPEEAANALETVIRQCEQWTDNEMPVNEPKVYHLYESDYPWLRQKGWNIIKNKI
mgnify:CR=1 FL=1